MFNLFLCLLNYFLNALKNPRNAVDYIPLRLCAILWKNLSGGDSL
jgi:hypothetical protein